jgi:hypothetical protein
MLSFNFCQTSAAFFPGFLMKKTEKSGMRRSCPAAAYRCAPACRTAFFSFRSTPLSASFAEKISIFEGICPPFCCCTAILTAGTASAQGESSKIITTSRELRAGSSHEKSIIGAWDFLSKNSAPDLAKTAQEIPESPEIWEIWLTKWGNASFPSS